MQRIHPSLLPAFEAHKSFVNGEKRKGIKRSGDLLDKPAAKKVQSHLSFRSNGPSQDRINQLITDFVIQGMLPLDTVTRDYFKEFVTGNV